MPVAYLIHLIGLTDYLMLVFKVFLRDLLSNPLQTVDREACSMHTILVFKLQVSVLSLLQ